MVHPSASTPEAAPPAAGRGLDVSGVCLAATAALGLVNLFLGFTTVADATDATSSATYFDGRGAWAWLPALLFMAGLAAVKALIAGRSHDRSWPLVITAAAVVPFIMTVIKSDHPGGLATGEILYLIFGLLQLATAAAAAALSSGRIRVVTFAGKSPESPEPDSAQDSAPDSAPDDSAG